MEVCKTSDHAGNWAEQLPEQKGVMSVIRILAWMRVEAFRHVWTVTECHGDNIRLVTSISNENSFHQVGPRVLFTFPVDIVQVSTS